MTMLLFEMTIPETVTSEEMEQARDKVLEIVEGMIDDDSDVE